MSNASRVHIFGASGSGTTSLGRALAAALGAAHFDSDDYFWQKTDPPFTQQRPAAERALLLAADMQAARNWVLSGSVCRWGDSFRDQFTFAVYLWIPEPARMHRLNVRERQRYGARIEPGGDMYDGSRAFFEWAGKHDTAGLDMRSRALHEQWLRTLQCPVLRIEYDAPLAQWLDVVPARLAGGPGAFGA